VRGDRRPGADQARRAGPCGAHVHLLLRGALGSVATHGIVTLRRRDPDPRRSLRHDPCRAGSTRCRLFWCPSSSCSIRSAAAFCWKCPRA
jgi:hypothetical protein